MLIVSQAIIANVGGDANPWSGGRCKPEGIVGELLAHAKKKNEEDVVLMPSPLAGSC
jgi:hypothetical protein